MAGKQIDLPDLVDLQAEFEDFVQRQAKQSKDVSLAQMLATPYGTQDGTLAAAFHLFQYAYRLGAKQNV